MSQGKILAVLGAQYGSEGKGVIVNSIANEYDVHVRVGSPNAGHTFYWNGEKHVMQSIPCGWTNPNATIIIGRGALINIGLLLKEIIHIEKYYPDFRTRLFIDADAGILDEKFHQQEGGVHGEIHRRIGSTGEGVGVARIARLARDPNNFQLFKDVCELYGLEKLSMENTPQFILNKFKSGSKILLEGTQGSALSLIHCGCWPYCTSIDTNAAAIISEVGIAPRNLTNVLMVARTYPIRVAGNSGPMKNEISWDVISNKFGRPIEEKTTVTKKVRRIAEWDDGLIQNAIILNAPTSFAITFMDYLDPSVEGIYSETELIQSVSVRQFIDKFEKKWKIPISIVGTGGWETRTIRLREEL
jgi:adenylosuccinate synthase